MGKAVRMNSPLERQGWMREGIIQKQSVSLWSPFMGNTSDSIIQVATTSTAGTGHTVVFDYDGALEVRVTKGMKSQFGKGVEKKKFSDKIVVDRYTFSVKNPNDFQGVDIGDLTISEHSHSRGLLADGYIRMKDQFITDTAQGCMVGQEPTHIFYLGTNFGVNSLADIEDALKTGEGFNKPSADGSVTTDPADDILPFTPFKMQDGRPIFLFVVDSYMARKLKQDNDYKSIMMNADVRGNENRLIKSVIGQLGLLLIIEFPNFFGATDKQGQIESREDTLITTAGLRQYTVKDGDVDANTELSAWSGQAQFRKDKKDDATSVISRGLLLGAGAVKVGNGKSPDYLFDDEDFGRESESACEFWTEVEKTLLQLEGGEDYTTGITDIDYAVIPVDLKHT